MSKMQTHFDDLFSDAYGCDGCVSQTTVYVFGLFCKVSSFISVGKLMLHSFWYSKWWIRAEDKMPVIEQLTTGVSLSLRSKILGVFSFSSIHTFRCLTLLWMCTPKTQCTQKVFGTKCSRCKCWTVANAKTTPFSMIYSTWNFAVFMDLVHSHHTYNECFRWIWLISVCVLVRRSQMISAKRMNCLFNSSFM